MLVIMSLAVNTVTHCIPGVGSTQPKPGGVIFRGTQSVKEHFRGIIGLRLRAVWVRVRVRMIIRVRVMLTH